jgi:hypothetical protein
VEARYHSIRPTRVEYVLPPTSLKLPRVPVMRPKVLSVATLYTRLGSENSMRLYGLLKSHRISNFRRSRSFQALESEVCAQTRPGDVSVLRPSVPAVNGAGYANAAAC